MVNKRKTINTGIRFPPETLEKLDKYKGFYSRNNFLLKIAENHLNKLEKGELQLASEK